MGSSAGNPTLSPGPDTLGIDATGKFLFATGSGLVKVPLSSLGVHAHIGRGL